MKSLSSSIVILAAAVLLTGSMFVRHDGALFLQAVGCLVGIAGLVGWNAAWRDDDSQEP